MALLFCESFGHYGAGAGTSALVASKWGGTASGTVRNDFPRWVGNSGYFQMTSSLNQIVLPLGAGASATLITGVAMRITTAAPTGNLIQFFNNSGATFQNGVQTTVTGQVQAIRGGTVLGTSADAGLFQLNGSGWDYVTVRMVFDSVVGECQVWVNGAEVLNVTGVNTRNSGAGVLLLDQFRYFGSGKELTDIVVCNDVGPNNTTMWPDAQVACILPNDNGDVSGLMGSDGNQVDNYQLVDEAPPDTADYVGSDTDDLYDTYEFQDVATLASSVMGVQVTAYAQKTDVGNKSLALVSRLAATDEDSTDQALNTDWRYYPRVFEETPLGANWSIADVNSGQWGPKVRP